MVNDLRAVWPLAWQPHEDGYWFVPVGRSVIQVTLAGSRTAVWFDEKHGFGAQVIGRGNLTTSVRQACEWLRPRENILLQEAGDIAAARTAIAERSEA